MKLFGDGHESTDAEHVALNAAIGISGTKPEQRKEERIKPTSFHCSPEMTSREFVEHFKGDAVSIERISDVRQPIVLTVEHDNVAERKVDSKCKDNLVGIGFLEKDLPFDKTGVASIDAHLPTKNSGGSGKGKFDVCVMNGSTLLALIEDKVPTVSVDIALEEAIYYCEGLLTAKAADVRIAIGYNGKEVKWRVLKGQDKTGRYQWTPFLIGGHESRSFPTPEIIKLIYRHNGLCRIEEDRSQSSKKALETCVNNLRQKYRQLFFIQNNNHTAIDFTIAFIGLKSILEKHGNLLPSTAWKWNGLPGLAAEDLKTNITGCVRYICDIENRAKDAEDNRCIDLASNFRDIFHQQVKGYSFDFSGLIEGFRSEDLDSLKFIYEQVNKLPPLHSSRIDLFGETYELLADKHTKQAFGQFFTGRHIIRPLIRLLLEGETAQTISGGVEKEQAINPKKFCDPACGTGGFLTEAFKYSRDLFSEQAGLTIDINSFAKRAFFGYDISPSNVTKTKINLYLAGDGYSDLRSLNTLTANIKHRFDYIITNPPYGAGGVTVEPTITGSNRLEVNFLIRIVGLLNEGGKALVVLPDGIFESPSNAPLREWLIKQCVIDKIVGLPKFAFAPYTKEKTYALFLTKRSKPLDSIDKASRNEERIWFYIVDNDGYANSDKRFPTGRTDTEGRWLHDELSDWIDSDGEVRDCTLIRHWKEREQAQNDEFYDEWSKRIPGKKFGHVKLSEIIKQEFATYESISNSAALKIIQTSATPKMDSIEDDVYAKHGVAIALDEKNQAIFKDECGKTLTESAAYKKVLASLKATGAIPTKIEHLFNSDSQLKSDFENILLASQIVWDEADKTFINQSQQKITKLLNLLPEKYFREQKLERIHISDLKVEIENVERDFKNLLADLARDCEGGEA